jgi:site-specific DNA-methyltransferase (adenine-specific)
MNTLNHAENPKILREFLSEPRDIATGFLFLGPSFEDTWQWNRSAVETYHKLIITGDEVARMIEAFCSFIGNNEMMAYLVIMAVRLKELHRVLKPTGNLFLHCNPTASYYL